MRPGFHVRVLDSREARRLHRVSLAVPLAGLLLAGWQCFSGPVWLTGLAGLEASSLGAICLMAAIGLLCMARRPVRQAVHWGPGQGFSLRADTSGLFLCTDGQSEPPRPAQLSRLLRLPGLIVLELTPTPQTGLSMRQLSVVLGCSSMSASDWRRLNVWLLWVERGAGALQGEAGADAPA